MSTISLEAASTIPREVDELQSLSPMKLLMQQLEGEATHSEIRSVEGIGSALIEIADAYAVDEAFANLTLYTIADAIINHFFEDDTLAFDEKDTWRGFVIAEITKFRQNPQYEETLDLDLR